MFFLTLVLKTSTLNIWSIKNTQVHRIKKLILKLNHGCLDFKPPGGSGIFTNVTRRRSKEECKHELGVIKCRQLIREGKSIAQNSVSEKHRKRFPFSLENMLTL